MACRCHSDENLYGSLLDCPECGHRSLDSLPQWKDGRLLLSWEGCERRRCGYERSYDPPKDVTPVSAEQEAMSE